MLDIYKLVLVAIVLLVVMTGCGQEYATSYVPQPTCHATTTPTGTLLTCPDGSTSVVANGAVGEVGPRGADGSQGLPGAPGTIITAVQLCPGVVPTYATVVPEVALCIGGVLYGTWNANTAYQYFAALPDGTYGTNGQNAACTFTITGCSISY